MSKTVEQNYFDNYDLFPHMAFQRPDIDARTLHRPTDPETSRQAAESVLGRITGLQAAVLEYARACGERGFTDFELQARFGDHGSTYRTRRSELRHKKLIFDTGERRLKPSGNRYFVVWRITSTGNAGNLREERGKLPAVKLEQNDDTKHIVSSFTDIAKRGNGENGK